VRNNGSPKYIMTVERNDINPQNLSTDPILFVSNKKNPWASNRLCCTLVPKMTADPISMFAWPSTLQFNILICMRSYEITNNSIIRHLVWSEVPTNTKSWVSQISGYRNKLPKLKLPEHGLCINMGKI